MNASDPANLPAFIQTFENLIGHFDEHFEPLDSNKRGDAFLNLSLKLTPFTEIGQQFPHLRPSERKSHDHGVDLISDPNSVNRILCVQARYKIPGKDDFDSIISKFAHFDSLPREEKTQRDLFRQEPVESEPTHVFMIVTFSKLDSIRESYLASHLSSKAFYKRLETENRLHILDGPQIFNLLQRLYRKAHLLPTTIELTSPIGWVEVGTVRLGALTGRDLVSLYQMHGDSIFFENIRDFLGVTSGKKVEDRDTVNQEIIRTIDDAPRKMLERNNGITFRAAQILKTNTNSITLQHGAIVNGCQTTMCLVHRGDRSSDCLVQVKVVETPDAWDIAKAANYQNPVTRIELDLAKYLRPQLVQKAGTDLGYAITSKPDSPTNILDAIYQEQVDYDEMKCLYLGFFSRKPNNLFDNNYTELRTDVLEKLYVDQEIEKEVFATLFLILKNSREALQKYEEVIAQKEYTALFRRIFQDEKPRYRAYLSVLAVCGALRTNLADRDASSDSEASRMKEFFVKTRDLLENRLGDYKRVFLLAFQVLADISFEASPSGSEKEVAQNMFLTISKAPFNTLYLKLLMRIDNWSSLQNA